MIYLSDRNERWRIFHTVPNPVLRKRKHFKVSIPRRRNKMNSECDCKKVATGTSSKKHNIAMMKLILSLITYSKLD